jgi:uncharacterized protein (DUF4415 family)
MNKQVSKSVLKTTTKAPLIGADGEVRELTAEDLKSFKPAREVLPQPLQKTLGIRGTQKSPTKVSTTIRLSPDVLAAFKSEGNGWQTRIDKALKEWLRTHSPA